MTTVPDDASDVEVEFEETTTAGDRAAEAPGRGVGGGGAASGQRGSKEPRGDAEWVIAHWADLCDAFPMQWIAVLNKEVIGHGWSQKEALDQATEALEFLGPGTGGAKPELFFCERSAERFMEHGSG